MKLFDIVQRLPATYWRKVFEHLGPLVGFLLRVPLVVSGSLSTEISISAYLYAKEVLRLKRRSGLLFTALYLKQCSTLLQQAYGGEVVRGIHPVLVKTTASGYPIIIPAHHRKMMYRRDDRADILVKVYLSWFSLAKLVNLAKPFSWKSISSIVDLPKGSSGTLKVCTEWATKQRPIVNRYLPRVSHIPIHQGMRWVPTWKSVPNLRKWKGKSSVFLSISEEIGACFRNIKHDIVCGNPSPSTLLRPTLTLYACDLNINNLASSFFQKYPTYREVIRSLPDFEGEVDQGRLASVVEGGGKRRLFVIGNYCRQRLLKPYHDWAMKVLRLIPQDGTFAQDSPIQWLVGRSTIYSYDLKSATDRWPASFIMVTLASLIGKVLAISVVHSTLTSGLVTYVLGKRRHELLFNCGQPLGYYASWPLFTLSHHMLVWLAADRVYPGVRFSAYGILGDDIVIGDPKVAKEYYSMLSDMGVAVSTQKSLVSHTGALEFAKRFWVKRVSRDLSPVSCKALLGCKTIFGLCGLRDRYKINNLVVIARLAGAGYRVLSRIRGRLNKRWLRIRCAFSKPGGGMGLPLEFWLGGGVPLSPEATGFLCSMLRSWIVQKELVLPPDEAVTDDQTEFLERTLYKEWMNEYLKALKWRLTIAEDLNSTIQDLLDEPIVERRWHRTSTEPELIRFGKVWRLWDLYMVTKKRSGFPKILETGPQLPEGNWILGGATGKDFLVAI